MSNADGRLQKLEKDYAPICDAELPKAEELALSGRLAEALEQLNVLERQTRNGGDMLSNARVLVHIVRLCFRTNNLALLNENIVALSKKHGALKQAVQKMVQEAVTFVDATPDKKAKLELIDTLRTVTEGKIYVEVERARLTRILAGIREADGDIPGAADILQELQVETFGSMEKREKTDFLLEQMRLCLARGDYTRTQIISRKISTKYFNDAAVADLKLRFYELMIQHALNANDYLAICKYYREVYNTQVVKDDEHKWKEILTFVVIFITLAPFDNEQLDLTHRIAQDERLAQIPVLKGFLKLFMTPELMRWPKVEEVYGALLRATYVFAATTDDGKRRWEAFHHRVVEHNLRVVAKYYTRITFGRLTELLDLPGEKVEDFMSRLVSSKTIYAKIDRPAQTVTFAKPRSADDTLAEWSSGIHRLLKLVETTTHLITKEEMVHKILAKS
ncbi:proteasome regulatory particle subunit [Blastocladiella emersonii ATCC 22665]|nr:proteasome regulatory particle subunit [Blastocladiella emersonii ATCC 22665]